MKFFRKLSLVFSAGCVGGLANSLCVWFFGLIGITIVFGVHIAPVLTPHWLYPRIVWGGLWGFLFILPFLKDSYFCRGLLYSLGPSIIMLFVVFPLKLNKGVMGLELGALTPIFVLFYNAVWGVFAAFWLWLISGDRNG